MPQLLFNMGRIRLIGQLGSLRVLRSQVVVGKGPADGSIVGATPLPGTRSETSPASAFPNEIWERGKMGAPAKKLRHPERSEASSPLSQSNPTRAQSKDPAPISSDHRSETELLRAGLVRRHAIKIPSRNAGRNARTTRSFDFGSAKLMGHTHVSLASAQDDGFFKDALAFSAAPSCFARLSRSQVVLGNGPADGGIVGATPLPGTRSETSPASAFPNEIWERGARAVSPASSF
jgi:hypothetical protein